MRIIETSKFEHLTNNIGLVQGMNPEIFSKMHPFSIVSGETRITSLKTFEEAEAAIAEIEKANKESAWLNRK